MQSSYTKPINLGSTRKISINELVKLIAKINNKSITLKHIEGPIGVMGRVSDNNLIQEVTGWVPKENLEYGLQQTYNWILEQINHNQSDHE
jgi:nucleoside-diphosphate-sugar epimerase